MSILRSPDRWPLCCWALAAVLLAPAAASAAPDETAVQLERITRERAQVQREAQAAQAACAQQFAVTACVDRAKAERRQRLLQLDRERAVLDEAQRKRRAADRLAQLERREAVRVQQQPKITVRSRASAASAAADPASVPAATPLPAAEPTRDSAAAAADAQAATRAAAAARRASDAATHRRTIEQRNLERAKQRPPAPPLPLPPAASR